MKKILLSFFIGVMLIACNQKTVSVREVWNWLRSYTIDIY